MKLKEYTEARSLYHSLEAVEFALTIMKGRAKDIDSRVRTDFVICLKNAQRANESAKEILGNLLEGSAEVEKSRKVAVDDQIEQARHSGRQEAFGLLEHFIAAYRGSDVSENSK